MLATTRPRLRLEHLEAREVPALGLDPTFAAGGIAMNPLAATKFQTIAGVAPAPGGKLVAAGNLLGAGPYGGDGDVAVARLTAAGVADPTFGGGDGVASFAFPRPHSAASVAAQPDGKIVVAGSVPSPGSESATLDLFVLRLNADGTRDTSFGAGGEVLIDLAGNETARRVLVQPDGKIVVAGITTTAGGLIPNPESHLMMVRLTSTGARDASFAANGALVGTDAGNWNTGGLAIQPDGKLVVGGHFSPNFLFPNTGDNTELSVYRFHSNGTPDLAFGTGGLAHTEYGEFLYAYANAVAVTSDGRIVVGGGSSYGQGLLAWFAPDGSLLQGERTGDNGQGLRWVGEVVAAPGGGVVASGYTAGNGFAVERHPEMGPAAASFQVNPGGGGGVSGLVLTADGKIVVAGPTGYSPVPNPTTVGASLTVTRLSDPGVTASRTTFVQPLTFSPQPGGAVGLSVMVTPLIGGPVGEGTVTFREGSTVIATVPVNPDGPVVMMPPGYATFTTALSAGTHTITASFSGTAQWDASTTTFDVVASPPIALTVALTVSDANPAVGEAIELTATLPPNGMGQHVTFFDGAAIIGAATADALGVARFNTSNLTTGAHFIRAVIDGAESTLVAVDVSRAYTETSLSAWTLTPVLGQPVTLTARVGSPTSAGVTPVGRVTFYDGRTILGSAPVENGRAVFTASSLPLGARTLRASYSGDPQTFGSDAAPLGVAVQKAPTATTLAADVGSSVTLTANVRLTAGAAFPIGTVEFREGTKVLGVAALDGRGTAKLVLSSLPAGAHAITAVYLGCSTCTGSTSPATTVTVGGTTVATTTTLAPLPAAVHGQTQTLAAQVSPGKSAAGRVDFYDGTRLVGSAAVDRTGRAALAVQQTLGAHKWRAVFVAGPGFAGSESAVQSQTVGKAATALAVAVEGDAVRVTVKPAFGGSPIGTVVVKAGGAVVGTAAVNGNGVAVVKLTLNYFAPATVKLTIEYGGSSCFLGSTANAALVI